MPWFIIKDYQFSMDGYWTISENNSLEEAGPDAIGPFEREEAKDAAWDKNAEKRGFGVLNVYQSLIKMIEADTTLHIMSMHICSAAERTIIAMGKDPKIKNQIIKYLLTDLSVEDDKRMIGWQVISALGHILTKEERAIIPKGDAGKYDAIRQHWLDWGRKNNLIK